MTQYLKIAEHFLDLTGRTRRLRATSWRRLVATIAAQDGELDTEGWSAMKRAQTDSDEDGESARKDPKYFELMCRVRAKAYGKAINHHELRIRERSRPVRQ